MSQGLSHCQTRFYWTGQFCFYIAFCCQNVWLNWFSLEWFKACDPVFSDNKISRNEMFWLLYAVLVGINSLRVFVGPNHMVSTLRKPFYEIIPWTASPRVTLWHSTFGLLVVATVSTAGMNVSQLAWASSWRVLQYYTRRKLIVYNLWAIKIVHLQSIHIPRRCFSFPHAAISHQ